jgi:two-component system cell cycle response regulator
VHRDEGPAEVGVEVVAVVDADPRIVAAIEAADYPVVAVPGVDAVEVRGEGAPVAVLVRWPIRHVGLGELGVPVIAIVGPDDDQGMLEALERGVHDVLLTTASDAEIVARVAAAARLARSMRDLVELARTDDLTGLSNRRHLDEHLTMVSSLARRQRSVFSLLMIDIDRTRRVNDSYGLPSGDVVVAEVAHRVQAKLRGEDVAGRWAGEEFVVLLPHTELDGAWRLADRIRASVCEEPIDLGDGLDVMVTVSIGCAEGYGDDLQDHLRRASAALEEAKAAGRNKAVADTA